MTKKRSLQQAADWPLKAYKNLDFLTAPEGRIVRVLSEFMEPATRFGKCHVYNTIVFFGSARTSPPEEAKRVLRRLENQMARKRKPPEPFCVNTTGRNGISGCRAITKTL